MCDNLKDAIELYNVTIPWYIMTSRENYQETIDFFENKNYFEYPKEYVHFFVQDKLPVIDIKGKMLLDKKYEIKQAANGNGDIFRALWQSKMLDDMKNRGIKWISAGGIDNILLKLVDPLFIGLTVESGYQIASKSAFKEIADDPISVFCKKNGKPAILEYSHISNEMSELKNEEGNYLYRDVNILAHLFSIEALDLLKDAFLPYHRVYKRNEFINYEGVKEVPQNNNSFKFEKFIFDAFSYFDDMMLMRVNEDEEFAPIKDFIGIYSPETAKEKYVKYWNSHGKNIEYED